MSHATPTYYDGHLYNLQKLQLRIGDEGVGGVVVQVVRYIGRLPYHLLVIYYTTSDNRIEMRSINSSSGTRDLMQHGTSPGRTLTIRFSGSHDDVVLQKVRHQIILFCVRHASCVLQYSTASVTCMEVHDPDCCLIEFIKCKYRHLCMS